MKKFFFGAVIAALFSSCGTTEDLKRSRAEKFYRDHPDELAAKCAEAFRPGPDSIGASVVGPVVPGDNSEAEKQLQGILESVRVLAAEYARDSSAAGQMYRARIDSLQIAIEKAAKRKCVPDTIPIEKPIYYDRPSTLAKLADLSNQLANERARATQAEKVAETSRKAAKTYIWWIVGIGGVGLLYLLVRIFLKFKTVKS